MIPTVDFASNCCTPRAKNADGPVSASDRGQRRDSPRRDDQTGDDRGSAADELIHVTIHRPAQTRSGSQPTGGARPLSSRTGKSLKRSAIPAQDCCFSSAAATFSDLRIATISLAAERDARARTFGSWSGSRRLEEALGEQHLGPGQAD